MSMSDRIMVLSNGQVQQVGSPTELYLNPANVFVASFMGPANLLSGEIVQTTSQTGYITLRFDTSSSEEKFLTGLASDKTREQLNGRASLLCRPDDVRLHHEALAFEHANVLPGTVSHISFVGGRWHTQVVLEDVQIQPVLIYSPFQSQLNQQVWIELPPEHCRIVPG